MTKRRIGVSVADENATPREVATEIIRRLRDEGLTAYFAGGCVRDQLLGTEPKDFDVATAARPPEIANLFPGSEPVGEAFGVMLVRGGRHAIEVATFRSDGPYSDARHPDHVQFADARSDAARRDFTINGLFFDPLTEKVIDYVGGRDDLAAKVIRAIGDPEQRLSEDHLRMLRAVRFAARYEFSIEGETAAAIRRHAPLLQGVSPERVGQEVRWMLLHPSRGHAVDMLRDLRLEEAILQRPSGGGPVASILHELERARGEESESINVAVALAAWYLDCGEQVGADEAVRRWRRAMVLKNEERDGLEALTEGWAETLTSWRGLSLARKRRSAAGRWFAGLRHLLRASDPERRAIEGLMREELARYQSQGMCPPPLVRGDDLLEYGLKPGPRLGALLERLYDEQLEGSLTDRAQALRRAEELVRSAGGGGRLT